MIRIGAATTLFQGALSKDSHRSRAQLRAFASPVLALLLLFLGCSNPGSAQVHENKVETDRDKSASAMIEEYQDSIRDFLRNISPSIFDSIEFGAIEERWRGAHSKAKFTLNRAQREERTDVEVDMQTGRVVDYMWPWPEPESKTVPISQAIPMNSAFEAATPVLEYYGLSQDIADYTVAAPDADDPDRGLLLAEWAFSCAFEYEGLPCRHTGAICAVGWFSDGARSFGAFCRGHRDCSRAFAGVFGDFGEHGKARKDQIGRFRHSGRACGMLAPFFPVMPRGSRVIAFVVVDWLGCVRRPWRA